MNTEMKVKLSWQGGAEALFGNVAERSVDLSEAEKRLGDQSEAGQPWTLRRLIGWLKNSSGFLTGAPELFFNEDSVTNGILVLVNDTDWELLDELDYELEPNDAVVFISTLHGG